MRYFSAEASKFIACRGGIVYKDCGYEIERNWLNFLLKEDKILELKL